MTKSCESMTISGHHSLSLQDQTMIIVDCKSIYNLGLGTVLLPRCCRVLSIAQHRSYTTMVYTVKKKILD